MRTSLAAVLAVASLGFLGGCASLTSDNNSSASPHAVSPTTAGAARSMTFLSQRSAAGKRSALDPGDTQALRESLEADFANVRALCAPILYGYQQDTRSASMFAFGLQLLGTVAGAVVVPALAAATAAPKSVIAAWGGVAGVTNTLQHTAKDVALGPASQYAARDALRTALLSETKEFTDKFTTFPNDAMRQIGILNQMKAECDFPPIPIPSDVTPLPGK